MATALGGVRTRKGQRARVQPPSIREVCLVGIAAAGPIPARSLTRQDAWRLGAHVCWSGRTYRVEATQLSTAGADRPFDYVHLAALVED
jgi:hypothetical protein